GPVHRFGSGNRVDTFECSVETGNAEGQKTNQGGVKECNGIPLTRLAPLRGVRGSSLKTARPARRLIRARAPARFSFVLRARGDAVIGCPAPPAGVRYLQLPRVRPARMNRPGGRTPRGNKSPCPD